MNGRSISLLMLAWCITAAGCRPSPPTLQKDGGVVLEYDIANVDQMLDHQLLAAVRAVGSHVQVKGMVEITTRFKPPATITVTIPGNNPELVDRTVRKLQYQGKLELLVLVNNQQIRRDLQQVPYGPGFQVGPATVATDQESMREDDTTRRWLDVDFARLNWDAKMLNPDSGLVFRCDDKGNPPTSIDQPGIQVQALVDPELEISSLQGHVTSAQAILGEGGKPIVVVQWAEEVVDRLAKMVSWHLHYQPPRSYLAIVVDDQLIAAQPISRTLSTRMVIEGDFSTQRAQDIAASLNSKPIPVKLQNPPRRTQVAPTTEAKAS